MTLSQVGNTASYNISDWQYDIEAAQAAHIDAFALNIATGDSTNDAQLPNAFAAANDLGFKLFFSFDYAGNRPWVASEVANLITQYKDNGAYFYRGSQPFVSTFEGTANSHDWVGIKSTTNCFFIPEWSSLGAEGAWALGIADGLFSWEAWPNAPNNMSTTADTTYIQTLGNAPYMMPVSPWFYTNLPGWQKNWLWDSDTLWHDRWQQVLSFPVGQQPEYLEIISWNDYGESHYIGPLNDKAFGLFQTGHAPFNYVENMPHDAWRQLLPLYIDAYKNGTAVFAQEVLTTHYRLNPIGAGATGNTMMNTASHGQAEIPPQNILSDKIYFAALLASVANVTVTVGQSTCQAVWNFTPPGGVGVHYGHANFSGQGPVVVEVGRNAKMIASITGEAITSDCKDGIINFNAWTGYAFANGSQGAS